MKGEWLEREREGGGGWWKRAEGRRKGEGGKKERGDACVPDTTPTRVNSKP